MIASNHDFVLKHGDLSHEDDGEEAHSVWEAGQPLIELENLRDQAVSCEVASVYEDVSWEVELYIKLMLGLVLPSGILNLILDCME